MIIHSKDKKCFSIIRSIELHFTFLPITVKFLNKLRSNLPKIETKRPNLRVFCIKDANGIANSEDPDQTAPLGAV